MYASIADELARLESSSGGRLGVCILDSATGEYVGHRIEERFGMCSTFKLPLAAIVLLEADNGKLELTDRISYSDDDMVPYAPVTEQHLDEGFMEIGALAEATQKTSDNVAANLLLKMFGGPAAFTAKLRAVGDSVTRLDRNEPEMNFVVPGDNRDTTTPVAMARTVGRFFDNSLLSQESQATLRSWMEQTRTGLERIRGGFPESWRAGDKTGTALAEGMPNKYNDIAVVWSRHGGHFVVTAYYEADGYYEQMRSEDEAVLREVGRIARAAISA